MGYISNGDNDGETNYMYAFMSGTKIFFNAL